MRTPFATLGVATDGRAVTGVAYLPRSERESAPADAVAERAVRELARYLDDPAWRFTVPLAPRGTPFQRRVWDAILAIPAGESRTYGELARKLVTAARAVGQACGANPIALIIPCHRVVGSLGALGGFMGTSGTFAPSSAGDLFAKSAPDPAPPPTPVDPRFPAAIKRWLLDHEGYRYGR
jgi:methylated-DNA-[protein]-cysteine S-methyltransferase